MSLRWNSCLQLRVGSARIEATVRHGWTRRAPDVHARRDFDATALGHSGHLEAATQAIDAVLDEVGGQVRLKGLRLEVAVSSALLHLDVVEGDFAGQADRQLDAIAIACVDEMMDEADVHEVRWQLQHDARHLLIAAIPRTLLETLQGIARRTGMRLRSVAPEFVARWNQLGRIAGRGHWVFAVSVPGDLAIATVADGALSSVSIGPGIAPTETLAGAAAPQAPAEALDRRVDRLLYAAGQDPAAQARFVLVAPGARERSASERWTLARTEAPA